MRRGQLSDHRVPRARCAAAVLALAASLGGLPDLGLAASRGEIELPGLVAKVRILTDEAGVPHIYARDDIDLARAQGYVQARDRLYQLDLGRRQAYGTVAALTGSFADLRQDALARIAGIADAARLSEALLAPREREILDAFASGANAWLANHSLPPEYAALAVSKVPQFTRLDLLGALLAPSFAAAEVELLDSAVVDAYQAALGEEQGLALYLEDLSGQAPMDPAATVPDATGTFPFIPVAGPARAGRFPAGERPRVRSPWRGFRSPWPFDQRGGTAPAASQAVAVAAHASRTGRPLLANDGHEALWATPIWYEVHLHVKDDPVAGPLDAAGITRFGLPGLGEAGQTERLAWGVTATGADDSDFFADTLIRGATGCPTRLCIASAGALHAVEERSEAYGLNVGGAIADVTSTVAALNPFAVRVLSVPFRGFGSVVEAQDPSVLSEGGATETTVVTFQSIARQGGRQFASRWRRMRARSVEAFRATLPDAEKRHWLAADADGHIAFFTSARVPLRADLEQGAVSGNPPWLVRDGSGPANWVPDPDAAANESPFALLPFEELPQAVDPPSGFLVNANEDPSGSWLDGDGLNQLRLSEPGSIYYLGANFGVGLRGVQAREALAAPIEAGESVDADDLMRLQNDTRARDSAILRPFLLAAWERAAGSEVPAELAALAGDTVLADAVARLAAWDLTTPTGIPEGYDGGDAYGKRSARPSREEVASSVAATLHNVWRARLLQSVIRARLATLGLPEVWQNGDLYALLALLREDPFDGVGAAGIDFFAEPAALPPEDRRDLALLRALRDALDELASPALAPAFGESTDLDAYRWGRLSRIRLTHPAALGELEVPPAAGFEDLAPQLPGLSRDGAYNTLTTTGFRPICYAGPGPCPPLFRFQSSYAAAWRRVTALGSRRVRAWSALPGGASGDPASRFFASRLGTWLTGDYDPVRVERATIRRHAVRVERPTPPR
jgi:penicillin amidase